MNDTVVSLASEGERRAASALIPELDGLEVEVLVARRRGALAGAAAMQWQSWRKPAGFPLLIHVLPDHRRRGVGRALLAAAADLAQAETDGFWSGSPLATDGQAAAFLKAVGAVRGDLQHHFEARIEALLQNVTPLLTWLARREGGIGPTIQPLSATTIEAVGWLVSSELGGGPFGAMHRLTMRLGGPGAALDRSQVATVDGVVAGVILWRIQDGMAVVDARVVALPWRGGSLNLRLLEAVMRRCAAEGLTHVRFHCDEAVRDTLSLARRCAAAETASQAHYYWAMASG